MTFTGYRLTFPDGLHLDAGGYGFESTEASIHSDTLFGALCCVAQMLEAGGGAKKWVDSELRISSAFPFYGKEYFFPKPLSPRDIEFDKYANEKRFRKVRYLSHQLLEADLRGELDVKKLLAKIEDKCSQEGKEADLSKLVRQECLFEKQPGEEENIYTMGERPRITVDRVSQATEIYHFSEVHFSENAGLFFLADFGGDEDLKIKFEGLLDLLGEEGIGADSTVGKGLFTWEPFQLNLKLPENANARLVLSLYNPTEEEVEKLDAENCHFQLLTRRGWLSAPGIRDWRWRSLRMFGEGSVLAFKEAGFEPKGDAVKVLNQDDCLPGDPESKGFDVWRFGRALTFPIHIPNAK